MLSDNRPHFDTAAYFARERLQGTLMPILDGADMEEWDRHWAPAPMRVRNARLIDPAPTLESHGFELVRYETSVNERLSVPERMATYTEEAQRIVERLIECNETRCLNLVFRGGFDDKVAGEPIGETESEFGTVYNYARYAHTDVSPWLEMQPLWNAFARKRHCAIYNIWRNTDLLNPVEQMPLAVCDPNSVALGNMVAAWGAGLLPDGNRMIGWNLAKNLFQSWYYYPYLDHNEALVLKLYDTREPTCSQRGVFHTAVNDPDAPADAKRRQSLDMRIGAVFEDETDYEARRDEFLAVLPSVPEELHPKAVPSVNQSMFGN